ncbi:unnamed protein product [Nyctereutes procyonoides]|uniref:Protein rogdi homolog n=1 Tax=Nyctereutes procyonoides TaxID=34880 RepID=A0A811Z464_NYCPR|nr:unnamed protein product [Nyctereutes procyonoides]
MGPVCPQSHLSPAKATFPFSFPFHFFVVSLEPEFLFPDLPVHIPNGQTSCPVEWPGPEHTHLSLPPAPRLGVAESRRASFCLYTLARQDVNLKIPRNNQLLHFAFREDKQWKLQQIQDARNHVSQAMYLLANRDESYQFRTGAEVLKLMDAVMLQLTRARNRLTTPATLTLPEIAASGLTRMFAPALPSDLLVNVYINLNKLCLTVYQLHALQPNSTKNFRPAGGAVLHSPGAMFEWGSQRLEVSHVHKVECVIPWLNDALVFFTVSLQLCQQLKDKISVFSSYWSYRPF